MKWTYLGDENKRYQVGLYHSPRKGYLLIHCNAKIVLIDFNVFNTSSYSFFIEDELCRIDLERNSQRFLYGFTIDQEIDTPRNRQRKRLYRKNLYTSLGVVLGALLLFGLFAIGFTAWQNYRSEMELSLGLVERGRFADAQLIANEEEAAVYYYFRVGQFRYGGKIPPERLHGLPLRSGDQYRVQYLPEKPERHRLRLDLPSQDQQRILRERVLKRHIQAHPYDLPRDILRCEVEAVYQHYGLDGWATLYHQEEAPSQNPEHNRLEYQRLVNSPEYQQKVAQECR